MSWCDKLASTPAIGVKLEKLYDPISVLLERVSPVVSSWVTNRKTQAAFTIDHHDLFACTLQTLDGYSYLLGPEQLTVEFKHRLRFRAQSGGPPTAELLSHPRPYTELLEDVSSKLVKIVELVTAGKSRKLARIGVVSTTFVNEGEVPPGFNRFLNHVTKPWAVSTDSFNIELTTKLAKSRSSDNGDRCIHHLAKSEDGEGLVTLKLDWQREYEDRRILSMSSLPGLLSEARHSALEYFEDLAQGERFDA